MNQDDDDHYQRDVSRASDPEIIDSAATTLLPSASSSRNHSFEKTGKYADIELEAWDGNRHGKEHSTHDGFSELVHDAGMPDAAQQLILMQDTSGVNALSHESESRTSHDSSPCSHEPAPVKEEPTSWSSLPRKGQLAILAIGRLSEPLTQTSLQSYMFYQLKSFTLPDGSAPTDSQVARQAGWLAAAFTGAQCCTALMWGRLSDSERFGRKRVILIGLLGTMIGNLGFGFSDSFAVAVFWRMVGGALNGNIGVLRTMISEIVKEKRHLARAFLLLPMVTNIGVIVGPMLGGFLADPAGTYPDIFGPGGSYGGDDGVWLFMRWPYALPNLLMACFLLCSALAVFVGLEETLESLKDKPDLGLRLTRWVAGMLFQRRSTREYTAVPGDEQADDTEMAATGTDKPRPKARGKLPVSRMWTSNVLFTLLAHGLLAMHVGTFGNLWFVFLSTPRYNATGPDANSTSSHLPANYKPHLPFTFTGGLALPPPAIGTALSILGVMGITLQLLLYPPVSFRLGTVKSYRWSLLLFPIAYFLVPYLAMIPSTLPAPVQASGAWVWAGITLVLMIQVLARTFALPATVVLVNNSCPHPSVLGTIHGCAQTVSSGTRTVGPVLGGWIYGMGLDRGIVGTAWWCMCGLAVAGAIAARWVREGSGHEIWLPEDEGDEDGKG